MTTQISVGLIGAGRIGRVHAENLAFRITEAKVISVFDIAPAAAEQCAVDYQIPNVTTDYRTILVDPQIDAVIICSSTDTHAQFITEAAQAGKHIFCEKPIALDLAEIDQALVAVEQAKVKLQVGFNRRFDPNFKQVHDAIRAGDIGELRLVHIISRDPAPPPLSYAKVSGGIFLDMTIHDFDMARYLVGSEVDEIYASGGLMVEPSFAEANDIDTAVVTLKFKNGVIATIDNCRQAAYGYDQRVEAFGSKGNLIANNNIPHQVTRSDANGVHAAKPLYFFLERYTQAYVNELRSFIDAVVNDTPVPVTGLDARVPVVMGLAAWKSYRENRPVKLSEVE